MPTAREFDKEASVSTAIRSHYVSTLVVATSALVFVLAAMLSPRWLEFDGDQPGPSPSGQAVWSPLYYHAFCQPLQDSDCDDLREERKANLAFSFIELFAALITLILCALVCCAVGQRVRIAATVFAVLAALAALISCVIGGTNSDKDECGRTESTLMWAFGLRVAETVLATILATICALRAAGRMKSGATVALMLAAAVTVLCAASLVGLAWERRTINPATPILGGRKIYMGLWDACLRNGDGCEQSEDRLEASLALLAATVALLSLYLVLLVTAISHKLLLPVVTLALGCSIAVAVLFPMWADSDRCNDQSPRDQGYDPAAGVGLFATGGILTLILFLLSAVRFGLRE